MVDLPIVIEWSPSSLHVLLLSTYFHPRKDFPITPNAFFFAISSLPLGNSNLLFGSAHRKSFTVEGTRRQSVVVVHVLLHEGSAACMKLCRNISGFNGLPFLIDISDPPLSVWHLFLVVLPSLPFAMLTGARAICRKFCGADAVISCFSALGLGARRDRRAICGIYKAYTHTYILKSRSLSSRQRRGLGELGSNEAYSYSVISDPESRLGARTVVDQLRRVPSRDHIGFFGPNLFCSLGPFDLPTQPIC